MISEVFNIDCIEYMKELPDNFFDLAIVDPPFGIGPTWTKSTQDTFYQQKGDNSTSYVNDKIPSPEYFQELLRVSKNVIIWGGNYYSHHLPMDNHWIIWDKCRDVEKTFMSECEMAWHNFETPARIVKIEWNGYKKGNETKVGKKIHPFQRPINLYKWCLEKYAKPGDKIFDSHMGSQSSRIAAYDMGFDYWGCELDKDYFEAGNKRFEQFKSQLKLF